MGKIQYEGGYKGSPPRKIEGSNLKKVHQGELISSRCEGKRTGLEKRRGK